MTSTSIEADGFDPSPVIHPAADEQKQRRVLWGSILLMLLLAAVAPFSGPLVETVTERLDPAWDRASSDLKTLQTALLRYNHNNGRLPTEAEGLQALVAAPPSARSKSPIVQPECLIDPWGRIYQYRPFENDTSGHDLFSLGADGIKGTRDDIHLDT